MLMNIISDLNISFVQFMVLLHVNVLRWQTLEAFSKMGNVRKIIIQKKRELNALL